MPPEPVRPVPAAPPAAPPTTAPTGLAEDAIADGRVGASRARVAIVATAVFAVGLLLGWLLGRNGADGAAVDPRLRAGRTAAERSATEEGSLATGDERALPTNTAGAAEPDAPDQDREDDSAPGTATVAVPAGDGDTSTPVGGELASDRESPPATDPRTTAPATSAPPVERCSDLDCRMTGTADLYRVPLPDDASALGADGIAGWVTQVASVEELTGWYREYLTEHGWRLLPTYSVLDPTAAAGRDLGHATSAIYCRRGDDPATIAVNIGWPASDSTGETVVMAIVGSPRPITC